VALAGALLAAGCGAGAGAGGAGDPAPRAAALEVRFRASDGVVIGGTLRPAARPHAPAMILSPQSGGDRHDFDGFVATLHRAGYTTLAYDDRAQGDRSGGAWFAHLPRDVAGAVAFLRRRPEADPARIGMLGASLGASLAVLAIGTSSRESLRAAVALSPTDAPLVRPPGTRPHDVLFVADENEIAGARALARITRGARTLEIRGGGHGVALLAAPRVRRAIIAWLGERLR
jgi:alpha-beta hydrolase superfamily lysophospholipase